MYGSIEMIEYYEDFAFITFNHKDIAERTIALANKAIPTISFGPLSVKMAKPEDFSIIM